MGQAGLECRLNDREYINWMKAYRCLSLLGKGLFPFTSQHMNAFHGELLHSHSLLSKPCQTACRPRGTKFYSPCRSCSEWKTVILRHHRQPEATVHWGNCFPPHWRSDHWELAKAYMPRGQEKKTAADKYDASPLLNLINYCDWFQSVDLKCVRQVIRYRNELAHSGDCHVKDEWMTHYHAALKYLLRQFSRVPQMVTVGRQIEEMMTADLSICVSGLDRMDAAAADGLVCDSVSQREISADLISQWEVELLQERLQELLHVATGDDDEPKPSDTEQLKRLAGFLQANADLAERFSAELQAIKSMEARE